MGFDNRDDLVFVSESSTGTSEGCSYSGRDCPPMSLARAGQPAPGGRSLHEEFLGTLLLTILVRWPSASR